MYTRQQQQQQQQQPQQQQQHQRYQQHQSPRSPKYYRHQQQSKTNPKRLRRTSLNDIEIMNDVPIHESFDATTTFELTTIYYKKYDLLNLTVLASIILVIISFILIIITFIFPNWLVVSLPTIKIGNNDTLVSNYIFNSSKINSTGTTDIDIGLWEMKFNPNIQILNAQNQVLVLTNASVSTGIITSNSKYSVLWLNDDYINNDYIRELIRLIDITKSTMFIIEVLEILHLIFTFFVIVLLFTLLCLCNKKHYFGKTIKLWHLVSYVLSIIAFFMGLGTLIQAALWLNNKKLNNRAIKFNWCYWCLVGELGLIFVEILIIQINLVFACVECYNRRKYKNETPISQERFQTTSANSRTSLMLLNRSKTTNNNMSTIQVNQQQQQQQQQPQQQHQQQELPAQNIRPSSLLQRQQQRQQQQQQQQQQQSSDSNNENLYYNERAIPRPNLTSSNLNVRNTSTLNNSNKFENYIYYNGQSTYRPNS